MVVELGRELAGEIFADVDSGLAVDGQLRLGVGSQFGQSGGGFLVDKGETLNEFPMVEHVLRESLSLSITSQETGEAERLSDWQIGFDLNKMKSTLSILRIKEGVK